MISNIFTVHDVKADAYLPPFVYAQLAQAVRTFADCVNKPDHQFGAHPADYTLFHIGTFDDSSAKFEPTTPISLGNGVEFIETNPTESSNVSKIGDATQLPERPSG